MSYKPYDTSSKEQTGNIITITQFEEGDLPSKYCNDMESGNESDDNSNIPPLISELEIDAMSSSDESDAKPMPTDMLEYFFEGSKSHPNINKREGRYKIRDRI